MLRVFLACFLIAFASCKKSDGILQPAPLPGAPVTTPAPSPLQPIQVVSGWDGSRLGDAQVAVNGEPVVLDGDARFVLDHTGNPAVDVSVPGFLPRKTVAQQLSSGRLTMWPATSEQEVAAVRAMIFYNDRLYLPHAGGVYPVALLVPSPDYKAVADHWSAVFPTIGALTGRSLALAPSSRGEDDELVVSFDATAETCASPWGFCFSGVGRPPTDYFTRPARVLPSTSERPDVILRALASTMLKANPLPGLMNATRPALELSLLEQQTLRMMYQRPSGTRWPDTDPQR